MKLLIRTRLEGSERHLLKRNCIPKTIRRWDGDKTFYVKEVDTCEDLLAFLDELEAETFVGLDVKDFFNFGDEFPDELSSYIGLDLTIYD